MMQLGLSVGNKGFLFFFFWFLISREKLPEALLRVALDGDLEGFSSIVACQWSEATFGSG